MACCCKRYDDDSSSGDEVEDDDAIGLTHVGTAAYDELRKHHNKHHHTLWNVTSGKMIGKLHQTPSEVWPRNGDPKGGHADWFPEKMCKIMSRTETYCDIMSLSPPDGLFMVKVKEGLKNICDTAKDKKDPIIIRMMFGNIVGQPVNCNKVIKKLTKDLPKEANIHLWVGAWRKGISWNHAKLIAVDGMYLHTGGHNMWDPHYLKNDPVLDLSLELQGRCTHDGHLFANEQWAYIERKQETCCGRIVDNIPDGLPLLHKVRVAITEYPTGKANIYPPRYRKSLIPMYDSLDGEVPIITMGRFGTILRKARPSDDAIVAIIGSAKTIIRMALQDLGPVCIPATKITVPGCVWPKEYMSALGHAIWTKGVDVEIVLSNPHSMPGGLGPTAANYGAGWSCVDVAAEIIKTIKIQFPDAKDEELRKKVAENLRLCFVKDKNGNTYEGGMSIGLHSKHFIIDDVCCYIGSQNLYICDLAEWGVVIDHQGQTEKIMEEYWNPMWKFSYTGEDCDVQSVMDGLNIDRDAETTAFVSPNDRRKQQMQSMRLLMPMRMDSSMYDAEYEDD